MPFIMRGIFDFVDFLMVAAFRRCVVVILRAFEISTIVASLGGTMSFGSTSGWGR
jgi:hypothetical protein